MKRSLIYSILTTLLVVAIASAALIGYNPSETIKQIKIHDQYDEIHDTEILLDAPADLCAGEEFNFSGKLVDKETGTGIPGKTVFVRFDGRTDFDCEYLTDSEGNFSGIKTAPIYCNEVEPFVARYAGD